MKKTTPEKTCVLYLTPYSILVYKLNMYVIRIFACFSKGDMFCIHAGQQLTCRVFFLIKYLSTLKNGNLVT